MGFDTSTTENSRSSLIFPVHTGRGPLPRLFPTTFKTTVFSQGPSRWFRAFFRKTTLEGQQTSISRTAPQSTRPPPTFAAPLPAFLFTNSTSITEASSLLRAGPPPASATVLNPSRLRAARDAPSHPPPQRVVSSRAFSRSTRKPQAGLASPVCRTSPGQ